jgi:hypothetical protein
LAKDRATDAIQGAIGYNQPYSSRRVKLRRAEEVALEDPKLDFRASAKSRTHRDDYITIRPYLVDDVSELANTYTKQTNSDATMIRLFGDTYAKRLQAEIAAEYNDKLRAIGVSNLSEKQKLRNTTRFMRNYNSSAEAMGTAINNLKGFTDIDWSSMGESAIARSLIRLLPLQNYIVFRLAVALWPDDNPPLPYPAERHLGKSRDEHHAKQLGKFSTKTKRSKNSNTGKNYPTKGLTNE